MKTLAEILAKPTVQHRIDQLSNEMGEPREAVLRGVRSWLKHLIAQHHPVATAVSKGLTHVLTRAYNVEVDRGSLNRLLKLDDRHSLVWLPSHRSYLDFLFWADILDEMGFSPYFTLAGANLSFWPLGPMIKRTGAIFVGRTKGDRLYRFALRTYLSHVVETGQNLGWAIEGGRTRTGKLRPPRYGAMRYVADAARASEGPEIFLIPISVVYDRLEEVALMATEARGAQKNPEGIGWLLRFASQQRGDLGTVHIDLGEPLPLRERLAELDADPKAKHYAVERLSLEVCHRINRVTPAIPTAVVTLALLAADRALTLDETVQTLEPILSYLGAQPDLPRVLGPRLWDALGVYKTLEQLVESGVVEHYDRGPNPVWRIAPDKHLVAAFYRNTLIHLLVNRAIGEVSMLMAADSDADDLEAIIWTNALRLRELLKFEFFFASKRDLAAQLQTEVQSLDPEWVDHTQQGPGVSQARLASWLQDSRPLAHLVLRPFFEAYHIVIEELAHWPANKPVAEDKLLRLCLGAGQQKVLQRTINSAESVTLELFKNGLKMANNQGLLNDTGLDVHQRRSELFEELTHIRHHLTKSSERAHRQGTPS